MDTYITKLIENLPDEITKTDKPIIIDLVLDGGFLNESYLIGALFFLKEMEKKGYITIHRISGSGIGSFAAFLYFTGDLEMVTTFYKTAITNLKKKNKLEIVKKIKKILDKNQNINDNKETICNQVNKRLFISYNNINKCKKCIKSTYKNYDEIINTIIKSSFLPFLIDGNMLYKDKYIDGFNPYIFKKKPDRKILHLGLHGYDKINQLFNVKNEKNNFHRVLSGLLEIHNFYIKNTNTSMCGYVENWTTYNKVFYFIKCILEKIIIFSVYFILYLKKNIFEGYIDNTIIYKIISKIISGVFTLLLETYCF